MVFLCYSMQMTPFFYGTFDGGGRNLSNLLDLFTDFLDLLINCIKSTCGVWITPRGGDIMLRVFGNTDWEPTYGVLGPAVGVQEDVDYGLAISC